MNEYFSIDESVRCGPLSINHGRSLIKLSDRQNTVLRTEKNQSNVNNNDVSRNVSKTDANVLFLIMMRAFEQATRKYQTHVRKWMFFFDRN